MMFHDYGPFANVITIASALVAAFSVLLLKMLGRIKRWTWLIERPPTFLVAAGPRALAVALMAITYVTIKKSNYGFFGAVAVIAGLCAYFAVARFEQLRRLHIAEIEEVGADGKLLLNWRKRPVLRNVVIGIESEMRPEAKRDLENVRKHKGGVSLKEFMKGYGAHRLNDPEALWDSALLAKYSSRLTTTLMRVMVSAVMALFWAAFTIEVANRQ